MAVKIIRQPKKIALIGAPTSAAALRAGHERAPAALRAAGLTERLQAAGLEVADQGDCTTQVFQPDDEHPRARNLPAIIAALNDLRPRVEQAAKSGALPLILGGDCIITLATLAGLRRHHRSVSLIWMDKDADLNVPATTPSGCVDGMAVAHVVGQGAPELVRFWTEPPLVREPDVALFGLERLDLPEEQWLARSPMRRYTAAEIQRQGVVATAEAALERVHAARREFVLHFDCDVISADDFRATNYAAPGGLRLEDVRQALEVFARQKNLGAIEVTAYNPELDPDGSAAKLLVELLASALAARLAALGEASAADTGAAAAAQVVTPGAASGSDSAASAAGGAESSGGAMPEPPAAAPEGSATPESAAAAPDASAATETTATEEFAAQSEVSEAADSATGPASPGTEPPS